MSQEGLETLCRSHGADRVRRLEALYVRFNCEEFRAGDPVSFVWRYETREDREVAAWMAAALAYGRVGSILKALADLDRRWEGQPGAFVREASDAERRAALEGFVYRWTRGAHVAAMLRAWAVFGERMGERLAAHPRGYRAALGTVRRDVLDLGVDPDHLFPNPDGPGACKRLAMWLRWMARADAIDPGIWADRLSPAKLWVPLDTHMFRISRRLGLTRRKQPDGEAARRITAAYARMCPADPLKYDFAITRLGMGGEAGF
ncbi:MAG: TIGR02757 family protein [Verrucomicrobia bacterium]|nr:TIGR02757 family protein [Verrucomicrobiota bacterium]MCH8527906.1 TIGR02757 family protein [Kiritimatiellia bacterium]